MTLNGRVTTTAAKGEADGDGSGRNKRIVFTGGSFRKGVAVIIGLPGGGFQGRVQGVAGVVFLWKMREKGKGVGGGVGTGKGTGKSMRKLCRNYPLAAYP